ncbi:MAG: hypothetical protein ACHQ15_07690 [Candidatus Limnocylindrales bacterium]
MTTADDEIVRIATELAATDTSAAAEDDLAAPARGAWLAWAARLHARGVRVLDRDALDAQLLVGDLSSRAQRSLKARRARRERSESWRNP